MSLTAEQSKPKAERPRLDGEPKSLGARIRPWLWLSLAILSLACGLVIKILTNVPSDEITITGAQIYFTIPMPLQDLLVTASQVNSLIVILFIFFMCLFLTDGLSVRHPSLRQTVAEFIVTAAEKFVKTNMGKKFAAFAPFIAAVMALSVTSSLLSLLGLHAPTTDINIIGGWAIVVFALITYYKLKGGFLAYVKGFFDPVPFLAPFNVLSEFATPVSMTFRHYGNALSGTVISTLVYAGLAGVSSMLLGRLPGFLGEIPFLQIGIPAVLSVYFDLFSGVLQAFIFAMLTALYVSSAAPEDELS